MPIEFQIFPATLDALAHGSNALSAVADEMLAEIAAGRGDPCADASFARSLLASRDELDRLAEQAERLFPRGPSLAERQRAVAEHPRRAGDFDPTLPEPDWLKGFRDARDEAGAIGALYRRN